MYRGVIVFYSFIVFFFVYKTTSRKRLLCGLRLACRISKLYCRVSHKAKCTRGDFAYRGNSVTPNTEIFHEGAILSRLTIPPSDYDNVTPANTG